ncbi:hypothetical protein [Microbacterium sp.]|uniref:arsenate reductase/protein-tyrosine-phosphatase family protein n=1 Tax=Microbacterium sp. TaxID=51671 RepID=UPI003F703C4D
MCTANVCRSPRAEYELREAFARAPQFASIRVASAGTDAPRAEHICEVVRDSGRSDGLAKYNWLEFADQHRSAPLTAAKIASAKLILTAGPEHRAAVARVAPVARSRTFTLREALWLGEGFRPGHDGVAAVPEFAAYANGRRGMTAPPVPPRRLPWSPRPSGALSIDDTHGAPAKEHRATIDAVSDVAGRLGALLTGAAYSPS